AQRAPRRGRALGAGGRPGDGGEARRRGGDGPGGREAAAEGPRAGPAAPGAGRVGAEGAGGLRGADAARPRPALQAMELAGKMPLIARFRSPRMSASLEELKYTLSGLPAPERAELAHFLLHTLEIPDEGAAAEWLALAERRMAEVRAGGVVGIP